MNNWLFGQNAWLTWNELRTISNIPRVDIGHTGDPVITLNDLPKSLEGNKMDQQEGVSCLSDENGELMFYSDGVNIWNKKHEYMQKTDGTVGYGQKVLPGNSSSSQSWLFTDKGILKADQVSYAGYGTDDKVSATTYVDMGLGLRHQVSVDLMGISVSLRTTNILL